MSVTRGYDAARAALYALAPRGIVLGLEPVRAALAHFGAPQERIPAVHIAGTNGKGSVAAIVDAGLRHAGRRVALYTSPHLHRFAERVRIDGAPAPDDALAHAVFDVLDAVGHGAIPALTFFEATTVSAWLAFARAGVELVVLEVGLGGRLDATSVCAPIATAITRIHLDHTELLGGTIAAIATEKAGILRAGVPCVLGPDLASGEAREAIEAVARARGAPLDDAPRPRRVTPRDGMRAAVEFATAGGLVSATLALPGVHQVENAAVAVALLERVGTAPASIAHALERVEWPARMERTGAYLLDVAHNLDGVQALLSATEREPFGALVFGASADKAWDDMLDALAARFPPSRRFYCAAGLKRATPAAALAARVPGVPCASVPEALARAHAAAGATPAVLVCGSIFMVAEARAHLLGLQADPPVGL